MLVSAKVRQPKEMGQCERRTRGGIMYKDTTELLVSKNFAQGFFFLSVAQVAQMNCAVVLLDVNARTNAAVWVEHHCHGDLMGDHRAKIFRDHAQKDCFVYFKSVAFVEFRFYFSFKATLEVALYGSEEDPKVIPNPFHVTQATYSWWPTYDKLRGWNWMPHYAWWWYM
nr:uncharacterized protein LOC117991162 [Maniola hyperantus]